MRLVIIALLLVPTVSNADTLKSGLEDPFASSATCLAMADDVEQGKGKPLFHAIALADGIQAHNLFRSPMAIMAYHGIEQNPDNGPINAVLLRSACREVFP